MQASTLVLGTRKVVTPTMRSWNEFYTFIEAWEGLRKTAA